MNNKIIHLGADASWFEEFFESRAESFKSLVEKSLTKIEHSGVNLAVVFVPQETQELRVAA